MDIHNVLPFQVHVCMKSMAVSSRGSRWELGGESVSGLLQDQLIKTQKERLTAQLSLLFVRKQNLW